ncbi:MAG: phosphatidylserine decarboxylase family protein [Bacteroidales bacterium]|nr:phosphatidylserine decarboxylase family protein [Bacteroidales bacterium]
MKYKIHREGTNIIILLAVVLLALNIPVWLFLPPWILPTVLTALSVLVYSFVCNFFRCPARRYKGPRDGMVVSSVDGKVVAVEKVFEPEYLGTEALQISVFMSPLNVHANWVPAEGRVEYVRHHSGRFYSAWLPKSSLENERSTVGIVTRDGHRITVRQVAGAMARRIVTYTRIGEEVEFDEHLGFIKFGSRVDLYLPADSVPLVRVGQRVVGDQTQVATLPAVAECGGDSQ